MYGNIRSSNLQSTQTLVPLEAVEEIVQQITNPKPKEKLIEADGGAYRAYCYNVINSNKH